ncbi:nucleoside triphosphate hydrolase [Deinococcus irradiatisoli]|uniref:Nucleoside triphosphate hydrolase n=1 Tax=Deinococcus irradiatisoli TaxID=2202254 RepID=A0A2Z3JKU1_9DEIO|nr:MazG family protein [Deinococcus irradiatisoli]AWN23910.1 nucleoside triphosphate hydrolase [Deinococcus irradiatisoli]
MHDLLDTMRRLRAPDGCPWDQEQTHRSLRPYLLEEAAEAADAISAGDLAELRAELGDVLLQVAFHSVIAEDAGEFTYQDVERGIVEKLVRRHPHVFGAVQVTGAEDVVNNWQSIKAQERGGKSRSAADTVPRALGALAREQQAQKLGGRDKGSKFVVNEALKGAANNEAGIAQVLSAVVAWARSCGIDPEVALRAHTDAQLRALDAPADD